MDDAAAKAKLLAAGDSGVSVHTHLCALIEKLLDTPDPTTALASLENLSLQVKKERAALTPAATVNVRRAPPRCIGRSRTPTGKLRRRRRELRPQNCAPPDDVSPPPHALPPQVVPPSLEDDSWKKGATALFTSSSVDEDEAGVPNVSEELALFEWAGVGLSPEEGHRLCLAMSLLKTEYGLTSVRFFGKVLGTGADYYVVEGAYATPPPPGAPATDGSVPVEAPGTGLNTYAYFVAPSVASKFVALPDVTPAQVVASRSIRKFFTGDLSAPVACYPPFPGVEKNYLRAQLARLSVATVLAPAGKFSLEEPEEEGGLKVLSASEDYEPKGSAEMAEADGWAHLFGGILRIGRCTNPPRADEGEEGDDAPEEEAPVDALGGIADDPTVGDGDGATPAWTLRQYNTTGKRYAHAVARCNRWPGAYAAASGAKYANVYVGYGHESTGTTFTPVPPPPMLGEAADPDEEDDVTLDAENALLKQIDEETRVADEEAGGEEADE